MKHILFSLISIFSVFLFFSCGTESTQLELSLHPNGITILCSNFEAGDIGVVNGIEYEVVDRELLESRRDEGKDLSRVCTSLIRDLSGLFAATQFNQPIGNWDVSNVTDMNSMFTGSQFNQPVENWDVSKVTDMNSMFTGSQFNQQVENWDVSKVTDMSFMFADSPFNQDVGNWDVSNVTDMHGMFANSLFNQDIGTWNVSKVTRMNEMFAESDFNQLIEKWDVRNVTNMSAMFAGSQFNQPIADWEVHRVTNMDGMFTNSPFNQSINTWCVPKITNEPSDFSTNSSLDEVNKPIWGTCPFVTEIVDVTNPATGRTWMDRNLGAKRVATSVTDAEAYGDYYQWGRFSDGHQKSNSYTITALSSTITPGHGDYILVRNNPFDWLSTQNVGLWQGENGINNPCPDGYRIPTEAEWEEERNSWSSNSASGAFDSPLKLTMGGRRDSGRDSFSGTLDYVADRGGYWSSTVSSSDSRFLGFNSSDAGMISFFRATGISVRCIKN